MEIIGVLKKLSGKIHPNRPGKNLKIIFRISTNLHFHFLNINDEYIFEQIIHAESFFA